MTTLSNLGLNIVISILLVIINTMIYYEILRTCWTFLPKIKLPPRKRIIFIILAIFLGHTIAVWIYGASYWLLCEYAHLGSLVELNGTVESDFLSYLYFSAVTYSSLGFGDIIPQGSLRFLSGVQVLNGLVLIGWSVSFTYLAMEKFWDLHGRK